MSDIKPFLVLLSVVCLSCEGRKEVADMVVLGGKVYTMDAAEPVVEAVAVQDAKIVYRGPEAGSRAYVGSTTKVVNLGGKVMTPGFIEGHGHIMGIGYNEMQLDLLAVKSYDELVDKVRDAAAKAGPGQWIVGRGWHQDKWDQLPGKMIKGFQTHHLLSEATPDNPVLLYHASGHAALANEKAMEIAGVGQLSLEKGGDKSAAGGEIIRDELNNPTGIFNERAMSIIARHVPENTTATDSVALRLALEACARHGITGFHDAGANEAAINLFGEFRKKDQLNVRLYVMLAGPALARKWFSQGPKFDNDHVLTIRSIKLNCDGALGSRGAWLLEPYTDRPETHGMATLPMDTVLALSREALKHGFQVCSHAIGDRANREILNRYETALKENPDVKDHRFRIEHAQHLHPDDIPRFASLGVIPAMQGIHMSSDRPWAIERLGEKRIKEGAYMWQSLLQSGARVINGTDAPVEPLNPIPSFYASVTRKTLKGTPEQGYEPEQKMTREQALRSYTLDAAYGAFQDKVLGSIEVGKYADFTVFSKDIMTVDENEILTTEVVMTVMGGKVVFEK